MYRSFSIWDRADEGLYRYRVMENLHTGKYSVQSRDFFGRSPSISRNWLLDLDQLVVELLIEQPPEDRGGGGFTTILEAIRDFDRRQWKPDVEQGNNKRS